MYEARRLRRGPDESGNDGRATKTNDEKAGEGNHSRPSEPARVTRGPGDRIRARRRAAGGAVGLQALAPTRRMTKGGGRGEQPPERPRGTMGGRRQDSSPTASRRRSRGPAGACSDQAHDERRWEGRNSRPSDPEGQWAGGDRIRARRRAEGGAVGLKACRSDQTNEVRMVGATGFEPATSRSQSERSTRLSYAPPTELRIVLQPCSNRMGRRHARAPTGTRPPREHRPTKRVNRAH